MEEFDGAGELARAGLFVFAVDGGVDQFGRLVTCFVENGLDFGESVGDGVSALCALKISFERGNQLVIGYASGVVVCAGAEIHSGAHLLDP